MTFLEIHHVLFLILSKLRITLLLAYLKNGWERLYIYLFWD